MHGDPNRKEGAQWFQVTMEALQEFKDKVRRDLCAEGLVSATKVIGDRHTSLGSIERHIIPHELIEHAFLFQAHCDRCEKDFVGKQPMRTRGVDANIDWIREGGIQDVLNGLVDSPEYLHMPSDFVGGIRL